MSVPYHGSKRNKIHQNKIDQYLRVPHVTLGDVCGGAGNLFKNGRRRAKIEVYNDIYSLAYSFFFTIRDPGATKQLIDLLEKTPYSKQEFLTAKQNRHNENLSIIEKARIFFILQTQSHGGLGENWSQSITDVSAGTSSSVSRYRRAEENIIEVSKRYRNVQITKEDFRPFIARYDREGVVLYFDPPYAPDTRVGGGVSA